MDLGLEGVPALVCGGSRGLGFAVAHRLISEGADVTICARDESSLADAVDRLTSIGVGRVHAVSTDMSSQDGPGAAVSACVDAFGGLQVIVANSGGPPPGRAIDQRDEDWQLALDLNFYSVVRSVRAAMPHLRRRPWGRVVAITSAAAKEPIEGLALSNAARAATQGFLKTISTEVGSGDITVNAVLPHHILTDRLRYLLGVSTDAGHDDPLLVAAAAATPLGRLGTPDEFAAVVAFLCSEAASYVNGVSITVDGGAAQGVF